MNAHLMHRGMTTAKHDTNLHFRSATGTLGGRRWRPVGAGLALLAALTLPAAGKGFAPAAPMSTPRYGQTATLLQNGKVLVAGGADHAKSMELYDPIKGTWTTTISMTTNRSMHSATVLPNGMVLIAGGWDQRHCTGPTVELYNPINGTGTVTSSMIFRRDRHTATVLADGTVLVAGGEVRCPPSFTVRMDAERYNPTNGIWTMTGYMYDMHYGHTATLMPDGRVLVVGGADASDTSVATAEFYDPVTETWTETEPMFVERFGHTTTVLWDGRLLVAGGVGTNGLPIETAEVYHPDIATWTETGDMNYDRSSHTATLLPDGRVLVTGGYSAEYTAQETAEIYDPATETWTPIADMSSKRASHTATLLPTLKVLITGGSTLTNDVLASAELYDPNSFSLTTSNPLPPGFLGAAYSQTLMASGSVPPYTWSVVSNQLPDGLTLVAATGVITGTPTASTIASFWMLATDAVTNTSVKEFAMTIFDPACSNMINTSMSPPTGGSISGDGAVLCLSNATVRATANPCFTFQHWQEDGVTVSTNASYTFMATNRNLVAYFLPVTPQINTSISPPGSGTATGGGNVACGSTVTVTATVVNPCYRFVNWTLTGGVVVSTNASYTFVADASRNLVANFQVATYAINRTVAPAGAGTISGNGTVNCGAAMTLTATALPCYRFVNWTEGGTLVSSNASYTFTANNHRDFVANFETAPVNINTSVAPAGSGSASGDGVSDCGSSVTVTATPLNACYQFLNWTEGGVVVSTNASYTFVAAAHRNLVANIRPLTYIITQSASPSDGGNVGGGGQKICGTTVTMTALPNACYRFVNWTEGDNVVSTNASYDFTANGNRALVANFSRSTYAITTSASPSSGGSTSGDGTINCGSSVTVNAMPAPAHLFANWTEHGTNVSSSTSYTFTVTRDRALLANFIPCTYALSSPAASFPASGGTTTVSVLTTSVCPWTATADAAWLSILGSASGNGNGDLTYRVESNADPADRTNTLTIAGQTFTVAQAGNRPPSVTIGAVSPITMPVTNVTLLATITDDGAPAGNTIVLWSPASGPGSVSFGNASAANTTATFSTNGLYLLRLVANDGALTGTGTVAVVVNTRPVVVVPPAITNAVTGFDGVPVVLPNEPVAFTATATDADGNSLTCFWNFGDGATSVDCEPSHVFTNCGRYTVRYVVTDGIAPVTNTMVVAVACPFETLPKPASLQIKVNFPTGKLDTASLKGLIQLPVGVDTTNIAARLSIGSVTVPFTLDRKGAGSQGDKLSGVSSLKVSRKGKPVLSNQPWQVTAKFKGNFDMMWAGDGLTNTNVMDRPLELPVLLLLDSDPPGSFFVKQRLIYKAQQGKSGSAK